MKLVFSFILLVAASVVSSQDEEYQQALFRYQKELERFEYEQQQNQIRFLQQQQQEQIRYQEQQNQIPYQEPNQRFDPAPNQYNSRQNNVREIYREFSTPRRDGSYSHGFSTDDGTSVQATGETTYRYPFSFISARGSHSHVSPEGVRITTNWIADDKGFQPKIKYDFPRK